MANPFKMQEVTMAQLSTAAHTINLVDKTGAVDASPRKSVLQPIVCIVTDHADTKVGFDFAALTGAEAEAYLVKNCAVFSNKAHGHPWLKDAALVHKLWPEDRVTFAPMVADTAKDFSIVYPSHNYDTFQ